MDKPRAVMPALLLIVAALFAVLWYRTPDDGKLLTGIKLIFALVAIFTAIWGVGELVQYVIDVIAYSRRELNQAAYPIMLAGALRGAAPDVVGIMAREGITKVVGIVGDNLNFSWEIAALPVGIKWEFAGAMIVASRRTYPYLWPIDRADELLDAEGRPWLNYERQAEALTNLLIRERVAEPGVGSKAARLLISWETLAEKFGVAG